MIDLVYRLVRPVLFRIDPERVHSATLRGLAATAAAPGGDALLRALGGLPAAEPVDALGRTFRNRLGLAAGFDKHGDAIPGWAALGFGFVELGTVTPSPQPGNPRPRLFRLPDDHALINRMGFNNRGAEALARRIAAARGRLPAGFRIGVNIGRGRATAPDRAIDDYVAAYREVAPHADYVALNVSSPNTPGLTELQRAETVTALLGALRTADRGGRATPLLVKLSPDLDGDQLESLLEAIMAAGADGIILANTTTQRPALRAAAERSAEPGGLSGAPLRDLMLAAVAIARRICGERLTIVACGGIASRADAQAALDAGATLLQVYTGLVYRGPRLIRDAGAATPAAGGR